MSNYLVVSNFTFVPGDQGEVYPMYMNIEKPLDFRNFPRGTSQILRIDTEIQS